MISVSVLALARSGGRASASLATAARRSLATTHSPTFTGEVYKDSEKAREVRALLAAFARCARAAGACRRECGEAVRSTFGGTGGAHCAPRHTCAPSRATDCAAPHLQNMFFSKEDEKSMRKLLTKMKSQADVGSDAAPHSAAEESALLAIVGKHKMSEGDIKALYAWRHSHLC